MDLVLAWLAFPALLGALCIGCGLAVARLAGCAPGPALTPACGLAAIVCVGQFLTLADATAELMAPAIAALAVAGVAVALPLRPRRSWIVAGMTAAGAFALFGAPIVLAGEATVAGYIKLDDTATWLALTDRLIEHGRSLDGLAPSSYEATLAFNLGGGYPVGALVPLAVGTAIVGADPAWLIQPYMALVGALLALALLALAEPLLRSSPARVAAAVLGSQAALLYGYYLWGGAKEIVAATLVATVAAATATALEARRRSSSIRVLLPAVLAGGALVGALSAGGLVWIAPILAVAAAVLVRELGASAALRDCAIAIGGVAVLGLPVAASGGLLPPTSASLTGADARGNLAGALDPLQIAGIWPSGDFRFDPSLGALAYPLIAVALALAALGLLRALRARAAGPLMYLAGALLGALAVVGLGSPWVGAKALATASPAIPFAAVLGCGWLAARGVGTLARAGAVAVAAGVLWSNALAYRDVSLAPRDELAELERIGELTAGQGPTLMTEYSPYGVRHFLRRADPEGVSELRRRTIALRGGGTVAKGGSADTDRIDPAALAVYRTLVLRRSPAASRPPAAYRLRWRGEYFEVWQRPAEVVALAARLPLGGRLDPYGRPDCARVAELASGGDLVAASGPAPLVVGLAGAHAAGPAAAGTLAATVAVPRRDRYEIWLRGSLRPRAELVVDGRAVGEVRHRLENEGGYVRLASASLGRGRHRIELRIGGADLHPGSGGSAGPVGPLSLSAGGAASSRLVRVPASSYERLCGRRWDWIERAA